MARKRSSKKQQTHAEVAEQVADAVTKVVCSSGGVQATEADLQEYGSFNAMLMSVHRKRAKRLLNEHLPRRVPYLQYLELAELIATFKVDSGDQSMSVRFA